LKTLRGLYLSNIRLLTLVNTCNTPWADSSSDIPRQGLTDFGVTVIQELNKLGMIIDLSHSTNQVVDRVLNVTLAPVIFSHSGVYNISQDFRNVPDYIIDKLPANGGLLLINFNPTIISEKDRAVYQDFVDQNGVNVALQKMRQFYIDNPDFVNIYLIKRKQIIQQLLIILIMSKKE
jgi:membrane dipeptidase